MKSLWQSYIEALHTFVNELMGEINSSLEGNASFSFVILFGDYVFVTKSKKSSLGCAHPKQLKIVYKYIGFVLYANFT